jgi:hypothetical protein
MGRACLQTLEYEERRNEPVRWLHLPWNGRYGALPRLVQVLLGIRFLPEGGLHRSAVAPVRPTKDHDWSNDLQNYFKFVAQLVTEATLVGVRSVSGEGLGRNRWNDCFQKARRVGHPCSCCVEMSPDHRECYDAVLRTILQRSAG